MRNTELPELRSEYPITDEQRAAIENDGHILLRNVLNADEVTAYRPVIAGAVERFKPALQALEDRDTYGKAFVQICNLWEQDEAVRQLTLARRFGKIAADLLRVERVRLWHDQALFKEPGGGHTPWHQDQYYWPLETDKTITMWLPLVDVSIERGVLTFASGSHRNGYVGKLAISDQSESYFEEYVQQQGFPISQVPMRAGDATFHFGWTLHRAPGNNTDKMREVMTVIYFADGARVLEPDNPSRLHDLEWLPGCKPGDLAASPRNPVVYP